MNPRDRARTEKSANVPTSSDLGPGMHPPTAPSADADTRTAAPIAVGMGVGSSWGPSSRSRRLTEVASCPSGGWFVGSFLTGKLEEPCVVAQEGDGCDAQVVGHELERPTQEVLGQADGIAHCEHREMVERPGLVDQVRGVSCRQTFATHLPEGHESLRLTGPPATTWIPADLSDQTAVIRWSAFAGGTKRAATAGTCSTACARSSTAVTAPNDTRSRH